MAEVRLLAKLIPEFDRAAFGRVKEQLKQGVGGGAGGGDSKGIVGGLKSQIKELQEKIDVEENKDNLKRLVKEQTKLKEQLSEATSVQKSGFAKMLGPLFDIIKPLGIVAAVLTALSEVARPVFFILKVLLRPIALAIFALTRAFSKILIPATKAARQELRDNPLAFAVKTLLGGTIGGLIGGLPGALIGGAIGPVFGDVVKGLTDALGGALRSIADSIDGGIAGSGIALALRGLAFLLEGTGNVAKGVWDGISSASKKVTDALSGGDGLQPSTITASELMTGFNGVLDTGTVKLMSFEEAVGLADRKLRRLANASIGTGVLRTDPSGSGFARPPFKQQEPPLPTFPMPKTNQAVLPIFDLTPQIERQRKNPGMETIITSTTGVIR